MHVPTPSNAAQASDQISGGCAQRREAKKTRGVEPKLPHKRRRLEVQPASQKRAVRTYHLLRRGGVAWLLHESGRTGLINPHRVAPFLTEARSKIISGPPRAYWQPVREISSKKKNEGPLGSVAPQRKGVLCTENNPSV